MRNISFFYTVKQFKAHTKDVTRRIGWKNLKDGEILMAVVKGQGIKKGELKKLGPIKVIKPRTEPLNSVTQHEVIREGFPEMSVEEFIAFFCKTHNTKKKPCTPQTIVTRIEFKHM